MSHPIRLERDTFVVNWRAELAAWATTAINPNIDTWNVRSDASVSTDYAVVTNFANTGAIGAGVGYAVGVHIEDPEETRGNDDNQFSLYAVQARAMHEDENIRPVLFVGESPASITSDAAGDLVTDIRIIGVPDGSSVNGGCLNVESVIAIKETTNGRKLCFGVAMLAGLTAGANGAGLMNLCVRSLIGSKPMILDPTKQ